MHLLQQGGYEWAVRKVFDLTQDRVAVCEPVVSTFHEAQRAREGADRSHSKDDRVRPWELAEGLVVDPQPEVLRVYFRVRRRRRDVVCHEKGVCV